MRFTEEVLSTRTATPHESLRWFAVKTHNRAEKSLVDRLEARGIECYLAMKVTKEPTCTKTGTGEVGGDKKPNAMFTGFVTDEEYPLAFIVCVEDAGYGRTVCIPIISEILAAARTMS